MRSVIFFGAVALPLTVLAVPDDPVCSGDSDSALQYISCADTNSDCREEIFDRAAIYCAEELGIEVAPAETITTYLSTSTPVFGETTTQISTTQTTTTELTTTTTSTTTTETTTTEITATQIDMVTAEATVTATVTGEIATTTAEALVKRYACPTLNRRNLARKPAEGLASACSCLVPDPVTLYVDVLTVGTSTSTATATSTFTEISFETSVIFETAVETDIATAVSTIEFTETLTTTSTTTAISTVSPIPAKCAVRYTGGGNGSGNTVQTLTTNTSAEDCCELCLAKPNCIASASTGAGSCQHLVKITQLAGAPTSDQCPLGIEAYGGYGQPSDQGIIFKGPCSD